MISISALCHLRETHLPVVFRYLCSDPSSDQPLLVQEMDNFKTLTKWYLGILEIGILSVTTPVACNMTVPPVRKSVVVTTLLAGSPGSPSQEGEEGGQPPHHGPAGEPRDD